MLTSVELFFDGEEREIYSKVKRKMLRDSSDPMSLPETQFIKNFRLSKEAFMYLLNEVDDKLHFRLRSTGIPNILRLAAALTFFAEGSYQRGVGSDFLLGMAQSTVSTVLKEVIQVIEQHICAKLITAKMTVAKKQAAKWYFYEKTGFPGVIGCVDGTHIAITPPTKDIQHVYRNRKGFFGLNAMIICDHDMRIRCVDARYGGSTHDSLIWNLSRTKQRLLAAKFEENTWYLGDCGYPLDRFLITPFRVTASGSREAHFNTVHSKTRNIVERTIGLLKSRFRCLHVDRKLQYTPEKATSIVNVCCALHKICVQYNVPEVEVDVEEVLREVLDPGEDENEAAHEVRAAIMQSLS